MFVQFLKGYKEHKLIDLYLANQFHYMEQEMEQLHTKHCYLQWEEKHVSMEIPYFPTAHWD